MRHSEAEYYRDDITTRSVSTIWQTAKRLGIFGRLVWFPMLLMRKRFQIHYPAEWGSPRVVDLRKMIVDELSEEIHQEMRPYEEACSSLGLAHICYLRSPYIGSRSAVTSYWWEEKGTTFCSISRMDIKVGLSRKTAVVFSCHSYFTTGEYWHTAFGPNQAEAARMTPPNHILQLLPHAEPPSEVMRIHKDRVRERTDLVQISPANLLVHLSITRKEAFEFLIQQGIYISLTAAEAEKLENVRF